MDSHQWPTNLQERAINQLRHPQAKGSLAIASFWRGRKSHFRDKSFRLEFVPPTFLSLVLAFQEISSNLFASFHNYLSTPKSASFWGDSTLLSPRRKRGENFQLVINELKIVRQPSVDRSISIATEIEFHSPWMQINFFPDQLTLASALDIRRWRRDCKRRWLAFCTRLLQRRSSGNW
jgi:hypothetical protein